MRFGNQLFKEHQDIAEHFETIILNKMVEVILIFSNLMILIFSIFYKQKLESFKEILLLLNFLNKLIFDYFNLKEYFYPNFGNINPQFNYF